MAFVRYTQEGYIGVITIERENAMNALNRALLTELDYVLNGIPAEDRVVVLRGAGTKAFAAGADISEMKSFLKNEAFDFAKTGNKVLRKLEKLPQPVIAAVYGFALGGGLELAMSCDIRIAADTAVFAQPETGLGIMPGFGGTQRLARIVGLPKAKELIYTGSRLKADQALAIGLVNAVYPADKLMDEVMSLAKQIADNAPIAVRAAKKAMNEGIQADIDTGLNLESHFFSECFQTEDQKNAMKAFCEKKKHEPFKNK